MVFFDVFCASGRCILRQWPVITRMVVVRSTVEEEEKESRSRGVEAEEEGEGAVSMAERSDGREA